MAKVDLAHTQALADLFQAPAGERDGAWRERFYSAVPDATLMAFDPQVTTGPDTFPYFALAIPDPGPATPFCITHILDFCLDNGCGATVWRDSRRAGGPEWVFSYGDLLAYSLYGSFDNSEPGGGPEKVVVRERHQALLAAPSEEYLPARARRMIGSFIRRFYEHPDPRIALVVDPALKPERNLMVNLTLEQYGGDERKLLSAVGYLRWFLPRSYAVMAMPPGWDETMFTPL